MSRIPRNLLVSTLALSACLLIAVSALAQDASSSAAAITPPKDEYRNITAQDIQLLRQNLRSERKQIIAANLPLTSAEAEKFWPVYDQYIAELVTGNAKKYELIKEYLQNGANMSDAQAQSAVKQWVEVDQSVSDLRMKYIPLFSKVLSPRKTALFCQIDRRVQLMIDLQLASALPLIEP